MPEQDGDFNRLRNRGDRTLPPAFLGSPADVAIIIAVALIVFGPKRMPQVGNELGQAMRELRKMADETTGAVSPAGRSLLFILLAALLLIILLNAARVG